MTGPRTLSILTVITLATAFVTGSTQPANQPPAPSKWAEWVEPEFPFFSSVLDAGRAGAAFPTINLTPRALVLNLGRGYWAAFDTDLLRVAAVWKGKGVTPRALAPGSYHTPDRKTPGGQSPAPEPDGTVLAATGIYPGWQAGLHPSLVDPREPAPSPQEVGRGPLDEPRGRFKAIRFVRDTVVLEYTAAGATVREWVSAADVQTPSAGVVVARHFRVGASKVPLLLVLGNVGTGASVGMCEAERPAASLHADAGVWTVRVPSHDADVEFCAVIAEGSTAPTVTVRAPDAAPARSRWPQEVATAITMSSAKEPFVIDDVALPLENSWRRNVRPSDIQFLSDGTGVTVTLDGDVWLVRGLAENKDRVQWRRFTSGLHEPLTVAIRDDEIYAFDRNGIWRLRDTNRDGEADAHELFSNAFAQTADMREFPSTLRLAPAGEFVIAKGGQEATTIGKHNGSVLRISADGRTATVLGYGFRQPNVSVNVRTGLVLASDQQGHYIPTTPLHIVRDKQFYGFLSDKLPRELYPAPIAEPLTWIPHAVNASAMSQVWMFGARMGPLNDGLVHIGFNNPELFHVLLNNRGARPQASVVSITRAFDYPPLNGSVNPVDGQLYIAGFQILGWGTTAPRVTGMGRVRYTGGPTTLPREVAATDKGILLRFDVPLDRAKAVDVNSYTVTSWNYQRTYRYGSPQFKADGTPGIDRLAPSSAYLSKDGNSVFIGVPSLRTIQRPMQLRVGWSLVTRDRQPFQENAYLTPYELTPFNPAGEGFGSITIDLTQRTLAPDASAPISAAEGKRIYQRYGCAACHGTEDTVLRLGPTFKRLYGSSRTFSGGVVRVTADEGYLRESILEPGAKVVAGYERLGMGMPSFAGVLTDAQIESIILYIKSLK